VKRTAVTAALAIVMTTSNLGATSPMDNNRKHLEDAQAYASRFEKTLDAEQLQQAYLTLENVILAQEPPDTRKTLRADCLRMWLQLLALLDQRLDPQFDPEQRPDLQVQPPDTANGTSYAPGADPALIEDPVARAAYQRAIRENDAKIAAYSLQVRLHRLNERITLRAEGFIRSSYTFTPSDREEAKASILQTIKNPQRREGLLRKSGLL
jgi:hypothetical protein